MWNRFTSQAKRSIAFSQRHAGRYGSTLVGPEYILLGLIEEPSAATALVLQPLGLNPEAVRERLESELGSESVPPPTEEMELGAAGKAVMDEAYVFARSLGDVHIGTDHLLVGVLHARHGGCAREVLLELGLSEARARELVIQADRDRGKGARAEFDGGLPAPPKTWWQILMWR